MPIAMPSVSPIGIASGTACDISPAMKIDETRASTIKSGGNISNAVTTAVRLTDHATIRATARRSSSVAAGRSSAHISITSRMAR